MILQKRLSRKYKGKDYYKFLINIPEEAIIKAMLKEGDKLKVGVKKRKIILEKE